MLTQFDPNGNKDAPSGPQTTQQMCTLMIKEMIKS